MRIPLGTWFVTWLIVPQLFAWAQCDQWRILNESGSKATRDLRYNEATGEYTKAVEAAQQYRCGPTPIVISMISVADIYHVQGRYRQSEQLFLKAKGLIEQVPVQVRARGTEATLLNELADLYLDLARYNDAQQLARQAIDIRRQFSLKNPQSVISIVTLAEADLAQGKTSDAEALLREEMAASKKGLEWVRGGLEMRLAGILASQGHQG